MMEFYLRIAEKMLEIKTIVSFEPKRKKKKTMEKRAKKFSGSGFNCPDDNLAGGTALFG